jgi:integrase
MPKLKADRVPSYRKHKQSGQAIVTLSGKDHLLGKHGTKESRAKYDRLIAEWLADGRRLNVRNLEGLTVSRVLAEYWAYAAKYYVDRQGEISREALHFKAVMTPIKRLYGAAHAVDFGPLALNALQQEMVALGWSRKYINRQTGRIRQIFKWAAARQLVPPWVSHGLATVVGLRKGKTEARESDPVRPVAEEHVEATLAHVSRQVAALARLQLLTGMRPGEVVIVRGGDINTNGDVWLFTPQYHKTEHHELGRQIRLGPKAREIIEQFWKPDLKAYLFQPAEAEADRRAVLHANRLEDGTPLKYGNAPGTNVVKARDRQRQQSPRYTSGTYCRAIATACAAAFPPPDRLARLKVTGARGGKSRRWETDSEWQARLGKEAWAELQKWIDAHHWHPNQLRHTAATRFRREHGIDVAQSILGHRLGSNVTEIYAEVDGKKLDAIVGRVG